jgi:Fic family protein
MPNLGMDQSVNYRWSPIVDWNSASMGCPEVATLRLIWEETRKKLPAHLVKDLNSRLNREWAIETGIIEGLYTIDLGTTKTLIEAGFLESLIPRTSHASPARLAEMLKDHEAALESLHDAVTNARPFSTSFVKELHAQLTRMQDTADGVDPSGRFVQIPLARGEWKSKPNNPTRPDGSAHEYCPPEQVASEMDSLIALHEEHESQGWAPEVSAAWLHHAFTQIHPFQDGNGRVARAIASLVLIRHGLFPLVVTRNEKVEYLSALEQADQGDPQALVNLFARLQRTWLSKGIAISETISTGTRRLDEVIAGLAKSAENSRKEAASNVTVLGEALAQTAIDAVQSAVDALTIAAGSSGPKFHADRSLGRPDRRGHNWAQSREIATQLDYFANRASFREWTLLAMQDGDRRLEILISIDGFGSNPRGVLAANACVYEKTQHDDSKSRTVSGLTALSRQPFLANVYDEPQTVQANFRQWVEEMLALGLPSFRWQ